LLGVAECRLKAVFGCGSPAPREIRRQGNRALVEAFSWRRRRSPMQTKKRGLARPLGPAKLVAHAAMGLAMGLAFALLLILDDPAGVVTLIAHGGEQAIAVCVGTIVLTFGIGATFTGAIFILTEDR
jgi:hypothetical protein